MQINISKRVKILTVILLVCFGICDLYMRFIASGVYPGCYSWVLRIDLLGVPEFVKGTKDEVALYTEVVHITQKQWDEISCIGVNNWDCSNRIDGRCQMKVIDKPAPLKECIVLYGADGVQKPYCNHWNYEKCIGFEVYDYIYQRPDILKQVIDILERPCNYINSALRKLESSKISIKKDNCLIKVSERLGCNGSIKGAEIFVLKMYDKNRKVHSKIVVERKEGKEIR